MDISIVIATYNRLDSLERLLNTLNRLPERAEIDHEIIVANNAREVSTAKQIEDLLSNFAALGTSTIKHVREPLPGKCRAQNRAIGMAAGSVIAFLDDDVEVSPGWLLAVAEFFQNSPFEVMQGPILVPEKMKNDSEFLRAYHRFRTIPFVQYRSRPKQIYTLTGGNMAIRKDVFSRVGMFDERLGPGCSGISEDVEFAQRITRYGGRIGYEPKARVYHEVDWSRLTEEFFRLRHESQGRSRLIYKNSSLLSIAPNLLRSVWTYSWYSLVKNERKQYRAKGRYFHYRAMFAEKLNFRKEN